jgi:hypothetical protein
MCQVLLIKVMACVLIGLYRKLTFAYYRKIWNGYELLLVCVFGII